MLVDRPLCGSWRRRWGKIDLWRIWRLDPKQSAWKIELNFEMVEKTVLPK